MVDDPGKGYSDYDLVEELVVDTDKLGDYNYWIYDEENDDED